MKDKLLNKNILILAAICVVTFMCFQYTVHNQFTNWDDDFYVTNDPYIKEFTWQNLKTIFTEDITKNNYHPLCMLSLAINYHFSKLDPQSYYLTNIIIHIANVILVFFLVIQLTIRLKIGENGRLFMASFTALWMGVHPMHVESVCWIAERKDVLYGFFYFFGLLAYLRYIDSGTKKWYFITYVLFVASCLSKPMAVVFPFSMIAVDFLLKRDWPGTNKDKQVKMSAAGYLMSRKWASVIVTEKILFILTSLVCGGFAFYTQNATGAIASFATLTLAERTMYAAYGFIMYVAKLFNPTFLSTFYPYPFRYITGNLESIFYAAPILALAIIAVPVWLAWKNKKEPQYFRIAGFGIGYFLFNVMFVLQFISVGAAILADRYSYVAYFGLFFLITYFLNEIMKRYPSIKTGMLVVLCLISAGLAYGTYERTFVWHDAESLLSDAIEKYPGKKDFSKPHDSKNSGIAMLSYKWRGNLYFDQGDFDKALADYGLLIDLHSADAKVYDKVAVIYSQRKDYKKALETFDKSLEVQNNVYRTYVDRAMTYVMLNDTNNALRDLVIAVKLNPKAEQIMSDSSFMYVQTKRYDPAIKQYNMLIMLNPNNPFYYFYRGVSEFNQSKLTEAMADWEIAVKFNTSKDVKQSASYNLSVAYDAMDKDSLAVYYAEMAQEAGYGVKPDFLSGLREKKEKQKRR